MEAIYRVSQAIHDNKPRWPRGTSGCPGSQGDHSRLPRSVRGGNRSVLRASIARPWPSDGNVSVRRRLQPTSRAVRLETKDRSPGTPGCRDKQVPVSPLPTDMLRRLLDVPTDP